MKIYYITNARIPTEKAHGIQIMKMCEAFSNNSFDIELIIPDRKNNIEKDPFEYYDVRRNFSIKKIKSFDTFMFEKYLGSTSFWTQGFLFAMRIMWINLPKDSLIYTRNIEIAWVMSKKGYDVVYEAHSWPQSKIWLYKKILKNTKYIVCNSKGTEAEYIKNGFTNTIYAPNGVDLKMFDIGENVSGLKNKLNLPIDKKIIMYTGHLYKWKGIDVVFNTAKLLKDNQELVFIIVGGMKSDIEKYQSIIEQENLSNIFLVGYKEQKEIPMYLKCADVLLLPNIPISLESEKYTSPIKMFEYMASKRPIIASDLPSIKEILNEENSILVKPNDSQEIISSINKIFDDQDFVKTITEKAFSLVQDYTWNKRADKIIQFFNK